jgi:hypothetical protein
MSLTDLQNFLARLYTDENLRRDFLREPENCGAENNLSADEIAQIKQILPEQIEFFADSLVYKRLREVEKLLTLTRKAAGKNDFEKYFREFAGNFQPSSIKKHFEDAMEFAAFLAARKIEPLWIVDLAKFEAARLAFYHGGRRILIKKFAYDIREILKAVSNKEANSNKKFPRRQTFAVWFRAGGRVKHFIF